MSSRSYLSIGDVLTLLREEFPDVTISKIRFLESQGLVNPERSPSGYRKFFEGDVERLRWVLRQQREHFLPLKVIRDRLAAGDLGDIEVEPEAEPAHQNGATVATVPTPIGSGAPVSAPATRSAPRNPGVAAGRAEGGAMTPGRTEAQMAQADDEAMARILADASRRAALIPESGGEPAAVPAPTDRPPNGGASDAARVAEAGAGTSAAATPTAAPIPGPGQDRAAVRPMGAGVAAIDSGAPSRADATDRRGPSAQVGPGEGGAGGSPAAAAQPKGAPPATPGTPARAANGSAKRDGTGGSGGGASASNPKVLAGMVSGASLTADELCAASGLSDVELAGLQSFGLIDPVMVAGIPTFDEDALTVANLAADFRKFGIEPRHLRMYRTAVDREVGLIEQVIIPLLRQRNPESRQRALDGAEELGTLGQTMRATLLRAALRRHVGG